MIAMMTVMRMGGRWRDIRGMMFVHGALVNGVIFQVHGSRALGKGNKNGGQQTRKYTPTLDEPWSGWWSDLVSGQKY